MMKGKYYNKKWVVHVPDILGLKIDELARLPCMIFTYVNGHITTYQYKILVHIYCIITNSTLQAN